MINTIITGIILYTGTAVDLLIILMIFFAKLKKKDEIRQIYLGQFLGSGFLIFLSMIFAYLLHFVPDKELLGLLGLVPIFLGLKVLLGGEEGGEELANERLEHPKKINIVYTLAMITAVSCGADNIGLFVPYFITLNFQKLIVTLITFFVMIFLLVYSAQKIVNLPKIGEFLEKNSRWFISIVYIVLGIFILIENNSIELFKTLF